MPSATTAPNPADRRQELLDAADQVIRQDGPDASMTVIAAAAGITKPILYRHFGDKSGLYRALAERYATPVFDELGRVMSTISDREERMRVTIDTYLTFIEEHPQLYRFLMHRALKEQNQDSGSVAAFTSVVAAGIAQILVKELALAPDQIISAQAWSHGVVGLVQLAGEWWLDEDCAMKRNELVDLLTSLLWKGMSGITQDDAVALNVVE